MKNIYKLAYITIFFQKKTTAHIRKGLEVAFYNFISGIKYFLNFKFLALLNCI